MSGIALVHRPVARRGNRANAGSGRVEFGAGAYRGVSRRADYGGHRDSRDDDPSDYASPARPRKAYLLQLPRLFGADALPPVQRRSALYAVGRLGIIAVSAAGTQRHRFRNHAIESPRSDSPTMPGNVYHPILARLRLSFKPYLRKRPGQAHLTRASQSALPVARKSLKAGSIFRREPYFNVSSPLLLEQMSDCTVQISPFLSVRSRCHFIVRV